MSEQKPYKLVHFLVTDIIHAKALLLSSCVEVSGCFSFLD
nr:hypothetical protein [uncultured bacterium]